MSSKNTVRLHRVLATKPEKVYRAFLDPDAMARWLPPNGFTCKVHHSAANIANWCGMSAYALRIVSTIRICPAKFR